MKLSLRLFLGILIMNSVMSNNDNKKAWNCLMTAQDYLDNRYDYQAAIEWFLRANNLYDQEVINDATNLCRAQVLVGLAIAHHNIGKNLLRDQYMKNARELLHIPENIASCADSAKFTEPMIGYFVVEGFKDYIQYEQCQKDDRPLDQQEAYLHQAKASFLKALEIAKTLNLENQTSTHAVHGLGTIFEFLGKCAQLRSDLVQAESYGRQSIDMFKQALHMREQFLGDHHPHVARSHHKLARNYARLSDFIQHQEGEEKNRLYGLANTHYQKARIIFEENNISHEHAKRKELEEEYKEFKKIFPN